MECIIHPNRDEKGYFISDREKTLIDSILIDFKMNQLVTTSSQAGGVVDE